MIDQGLSELSVSGQCELLGLNRSGVYYTPRPVREGDLILMRRIDELHLKYPFYGARRLAKQLVRDGFDVGRVHVATLMRRMGIEALYRRPRTSIPARDSLIYPYLLGGLKIDRANQAWASDLTYLPMAHGFLFLVAILDVASRKVLSFRVSNTMTPDFCVEALEEAIARFGAPEIMNTDQGSQFTSAAWIDVLKADDTCISMDGKGRWIGRVEMWRGDIRFLSAVAAAFAGGVSIDEPSLRFHIPLIEPDMQLYRIRLSRRSLRPSISPRLPGFRGVRRGRVSRRDTRWGIGDTHCLSSLAAGSAIAGDGVWCISGSPGMRG
jgi:putative transposase